MKAPPLNGKQTVAERLVELFRGRAEYVARGTERGTFEPAKLPGPMKPEWLARHLGGQQCAGFYVMTPDNRVWCSCADFDNKSDHPDPAWKEKAETAYLWLQKAGLSPLVEISQSGEAAHVWLFFDPSAEAWVARAWWALVAQQSSVTIKEVYPRQDVLTGKALGNLVRYPLWNQSRFVDPENDWATVNPEQALGSVTRTTGAELLELAYRLGSPLKRPNLSTGSGTGDDTEGELPATIKARLERSPHGLLAKRWKGDMAGLNDKSRSALVQAIACELVRQFVPDRTVEAAVRFWCREHDYDKGEREKWVRDTVEHAHEFLCQRTEERSANAVKLKDACHAFLDTLERGERTHVASGIADLDASVEGVGFGEMCVIAARPGHGKSALALQWLDTASGSGLPCLLISEEMSYLEIGKRSVLYLSKLGQEHWGGETVHLLRDDVEAHYQGRAPVYVVENCMTAQRCEEVIDQFTDQHGVRVVAVDYLQLLGSRGQKRYEQVTDISMRLKQAAKRNNVALLALSQLNRELEKRNPPEPKLSDMRDSGQVEQDADLILFVVWPHKLDPLMTADQYTIFAAKRRNGPIHQQRIDTTFTPSRQRIGPFPVASRLPGDE